MSHLLQTPAWGELKARFGWEAEPVADQLILYRRLPLGLRLAYVPRGQLPDSAQLNALATVARRRGAFMLKLEPDREDTPQNAATLSALGLRPSTHTIQPRRSIVVDIDDDAEAVLARMKQKTRYNIRLAEKKGVQARIGSVDDLPAFNALMQETGARDGFGVHAPAYYTAAYESFARSGQVALALAELDGRLLAAVMAFVSDDMAWYLYGASSDHERQRMAPYLAQWAAMNWARGKGARAYDLWGVPDADEAELEAGLETRHDGLWGVYRFKRGWGGRLTRTVGAWDQVYNPMLYRLYTWYVARRGTGE
ncbi:MAG TPA: peptidoglycan bridge formation glycyltransferase FemA/FemB family protein [Anaerolineales bacterium]|nr:peptidoglycan bridge formation glycyltransferase FemA/FemB family protein [Anaerolineales bacterium]